MINQMEPSYGEAEKQAIQSYLDSGGWLTEFTNTREFEKRVGEYVGAEYAHTASNGTIGLVVALMALNIGNGDEVIIPNFTHIATAYAVDLVGATPVMVDVDYDTLCLDPNRLDSAVSEETAAIIYVSLNGRSHGIDRVKEFATRHNLALVEDAAQSLGSRHNGSHLGTIGDIGVFSFSYAKIITTGQGSIIVTDDAEISEQVEMVRDFGRPESGVDNYNILGLNAKFTDLQAVIGLAQMDRLAERVEFKKDLYRQYRSQMTDISAIRFPDTDLDQTPPWFVDIVVKSGNRKGLAAFLEQADIGSRPFYPPVHTQGPYANQDESYPVTVEISENGLWLPSAPTLNVDDVDHICDRIREYFRQ